MCIKLHIQPNFHANIACTSRQDFWMPANPAIRLLTLPNDAWCLHFRPRHCGIWCPKRAAKSRQRCPNGSRRKEATLGASSERQSSTERLTGQHALPLTENQKLSANWMNLRQFWGQSLLGRKKCWAVTFEIFRFRSPALLFYFVPQPWIFHGGWRWKHFTLHNKLARLSHRYEIWSPALKYPYSSAIPVGFWDKLMVYFDSFKNRCK